MQSLKYYFVILLFLIPVVGFSQTTITGKVIKVSDGDTFIILTEKKEQIKIRLFGVDTPERGQPFYNKARNYLNNLIYGKTVIIEDKGTDKFNRMLGLVRIGDIDINESLLTDGLAWHYVYFYKSERYASLEQAARKKEKNIWSEKNPTPPWEYRRNKNKRLKNKDHE